MSANFYCWTPALGLDPKARDFHDRVEVLQEAEPSSPASPQLLGLVAALLARYPDLDDDNDTVWAAGPLRDEIIGDFINVAVVWPRVEEAETFIRETAHKHGLHFYDPQSDVFYPCPSNRSADQPPPLAKGKRRWGWLPITTVILIILAALAWVYRDAF